MKKVRVVVESLDDRELARGSQVPATESVTISLGKKTRVLDLSAGNLKALTDQMAPWLDAGHKPSEAAGRPVRPGTGGTREARDWWDGFRLWCEQRNYTYRLPGGSMNYKSRHLPEYRAWLAQQPDGAKIA